MPDSKMSIIAILKSFYGETQTHQFLADGSLVHELIYSLPKIIVKT